MAQEWSWAHSIDPPKSEDPVDWSYSPLDADIALSDQSPSSPLVQVTDQPQLRTERLDLLHSLVSNFTKVYDRLTAVRDEVMLLRNMGIYERQECSHRRRFFSEAQEALAQELLSLDSHNAEKAMRVKELQQQLEDDMEAVNAQDQRASQIELEISQKELKLRNEEAALAEACDKLQVKIEQYDGPNFEERADQASFPIAITRHASTRSPSPAPLPALEYYYKKAGQVGWREERLADLQIELRELRVDRSFKRDREEILDTTDDEFEAECRQKLLRAQRGLEKAISNAAKAKDICYKQGLDPDVPLHLRSASGVLNAEGLSEAVNDEWRPDSEEKESQGSNVRRDNPLAVLPSNTSERNHSSTFLTSLTGPLNLDVPLRQSPNRKSTQGHRHVQDWVKSTQLHEQQYPFDEDQVELYPVTRPISHAWRSINDFKELPVVDADIVGSNPRQLRQQSHAGPDMFLKSGRRARIRDSRSLSEPEILLIMSTKSFASG